MVTTNHNAFLALSAYFDASEHKRFNAAKAGRPPRWLTYVPDETVLDRLDDAIGPGNWNLDVEPVAAGVAKVTLGVKWPDRDAFLTYSDFGYHTNGEDGEAFKEAVSDGIRRVARLVGVARYVYRGEVDATPPAGEAPPAPQATAAAPSGSGGRSYRPNGEQAAAEAEQLGQCPEHGALWKGAPGDRYHKKDDGGYCRAADNVRRPRRAA